MNSLRKKKTHWLLGCLFSVFLLPTSTLAAPENITIRPFLIDETLHARDSVSREITLRSEYDVRKAVLYATVNEVTLNTRGDIKAFEPPVMSDRTDTVTSWVAIDRGRIELPAGASTTVPLTITIHPHAKPGEYHIFVGFVEAPNRPAAEVIALSGDARGVIVQVTVADDRTDSLAIKNVLLDRFIFRPNEAVGKIHLLNTGELPVTPTGEVVFYNARGQEVAATQLNTLGETIEPTLSTELSFPMEVIAGFGKYKANTTIRYGDRQDKVIQDTTFFYVVSIWWLVLFFGGVVLTLGVLLYWWQRHYNDHNDDDDVALFVRNQPLTEFSDHDVDLTPTKKN